MNEPTPEKELTDEDITNASLFNLGLSPGWKNIKGHVFRVRHFTSFSEVNGVDVKATFGMMAMYGFLVVQSPLLARFGTAAGYPANRGYATLPLNHRVNFLQARYVYETSTWAEWIRDNGYELLVTHSPAGFPLGLAAPPLHYRIMPRGSLDRFYATDPKRLSRCRAEDLFGKLSYLIQPEELQALAGVTAGTPTSIPRLDGPTTP